MGAASASRRPGAPRQERSEITRQRLLDATVDCLTDLGYANTTTAAISERAGVSRGAQQHHFPQKASLIAEAILSLRDREFADLRRRAKRLSPGPDHTEQLLELLWRLVHSKLFLASAEVALSGRHESDLAPTIQAAQRTHYQTMFALCRELFEPQLTQQPGFDERLTLVLAALCGLALPTGVRPLERHGRSEGAWQFVRHELSRTLRGA